MAKKIALLSGKGGSGKTSLCLSIADLLSSCGIKTLLVDCDFSTNGATYFFEDKLESNRTVLSLERLLQGSDADGSTIFINDNLDFIPSVSNLNFSNTGNESSYDKIVSNIDGISEKYDVVIFDCQAGYSRVLDFVLPAVDESLFVLEADAISSSAIRSLFLKIGTHLKNKKAYQIFNKVTPEEYDVYNKISGGTLFTNIETVKFDWRIRKAFALSLVPNFENVSIFYMEQLLSICRVLFKETEFQEKMEIVAKKISSYRLKRRQDFIFERLHEIKSDKRKTMRKIFSVGAVSYSIIALCVTVYILFAGKPVSLFVESLDASFLSAVLMGIISSVLAIFMFVQIKAKKEQNKTFAFYEKELHQIEKSLSNCFVDSQNDDQQDLN